MTKEEAKEIFINRGFVNGLFDGDKWRQSIVVISKWLEQEPCEDWYDVPSDEMTLEQARQAVKDLRKKLAEYLEQEPCDDCISRKAVLDIAKASKSNWIDNSVLFKRVNELPPVTPKPKTECSCDQIKWERDTAVAQLKELGYGLGEKPKMGHWKYYRNNKGDWVNECSACGLDAGVGYPYPFCPNCGAKMESEDKQ